MPDPDPNTPRPGSAGADRTAATSAATKAASAPLPVVEGPYLRDILDQPAALHRAARGLRDVPSLAGLKRKLADGALRRVVLTGMGSSLYALYPLHLALSRHGTDSFWVETSELLLGFETLCRPDTLLVAVSQSGESVEIVNLLSRAAAFGHVLGVTNRENSPLGLHAGTRLLLHAGAEATVACKSYVTTLAVLHWLGAGLCGDDPAKALGDLEAATPAVADYLDRWREHVAELIPWTEGIQSVFVTGRGESLATAGTAGLILKESTRRHAEGMSGAAFRHGPLEMAGPRALVLVYAGDERVSRLNRRLAEDVNRHGGRAAVVADDVASGPVFTLPPTAPALRPITEILPAQMLSIALAARDGREAGRFERASKITTTE
ncbi:MAG: SIS domain-containing protein [Verrucomicrobia bacterium]|nr:SIS domain-containing protein [Verrucomicrobiota bacterium]